MDAKTKRNFIIFFTVSFPLLAAYWFFYLVPRYSPQIDTFPQIITFIVIYGLCVIFTLFDWLRTLFSRILDYAFDLSPKTVALFFISFFLSFPLLVYFGQSSVPDDNVLPPSLKFNIIEISAVLGGLVLAAAALSKLDADIRERLVSVSRYLILATVMFVFFAILAYNAHLPIEGLSGYTGTCKWIYVVLFLVASTSFFMGIIKLVVTLFRLKIKEKAPTPQ